MKNVLFLATLVILFSACRSLRTVSTNKTNHSSTSKISEDSAKKTSSFSTFHTKSVTNFPDSVTSKPDSAKTTFSFNPADVNDSVSAEVETSTLKGVVKFNKATGKGSFSMYKKPENILVPGYKEQETTGIISNSDSSGHNKNFEASATSVQNNKDSSKKTSWAWAYIAAAFVLLLLFVSGYFWLRNQYVNPKRPSL